jgi:hypothetical protein
MVIRGAGRWQERLPAFDAQVSLMLPSGSGQRLDRQAR